MNEDYSIEEINRIAKKIIAFSKHKVLLFYGEMGVGKTTLIKEVCKVLGVKDLAQSPTFSLVNEYLSDRGEVVYHFDFYRIEEEAEAYDIGIEEYLYSNNWCLIEWAENIKNLLPLKTVKIHLLLLENGKRNIRVY